MEKYIGKCLDSLLIPEFDQVEVLVVNDGSKDRSSEIAHSYADRYPDSIRIIDKTNGNYGSCINAALPQATGRYVKILDADDTFDTVAFSELVKLLSRVDDDAVLTNHIIVNDDNEPMEQTTFDDICQNNTTMFVEDAIHSVLSSYVQMHRIAYKKDVFSRFSYKQTEGVSYTDSQWSIIPMAYCRTVRYVNLCVYRYLRGRDGQTMNESQMKRSLNNFFDTLKDTVGYYNNFNYSSIGKQLFLKHILEVHEFVYITALGMKNSEAMKLLENYDRELDQKCNEIYNKIALMPWTNEVPFHWFNDIREKGYPSYYKIPFFKRLELSFKIRFKRIVN